MKREGDEAAAAVDPGPYGSGFDDFLAGQGILEGCTERAVKAVLAWQLDQTRREAGLSKSEFARKLRTSRSQVDRLLDPDNDAVTVEALRKAAGLLGRDIRLELVDAGQAAGAEGRPGESGPMDV